FFIRSRWLDCTGRRYGCLFLFHNEYLQVVENNVYASVLLSDFFNYKSYFSFYFAFLSIDRALI
ncbi:hypothetical protein ACNI5L_34730, partial [Klebsiella pneumoniae]|uniref:hypothetical protein n=1 Tax=Klebsiella pneumoniae TaxID=573 RepID=UPI003A8A86AC